MLAGDKYGHGMIMNENNFLLRILKNPLAMVWGLLSSCCVLFLVFATPPMQVPDEQNHFLRVVQIARGGIVGIKLNPLDSGGKIPSDSIKFAHSYDDLPFHYERKVDWSRVVGETDLRWKSDLQLAGFPNTVIYSPIFYIPSVVGIEIGRIFQRSIVTSFYIARIFSGIFCVVLGTLALMIAKRGVLLIAMLLSMPMVLFLFASCSQDGPLIAASALCAGLLTRLDENDELLETRWFWPVLAILSGSILASKPPYILIAFIPLVLVPRHYWRQAAICAGAAIGILMVWSLVGVHSTKVPFLPGQGVNSGKQLHFLLTHPTKIFPVLFHTFKYFGMSFKQQFVGVLGWVDAPLSSWSYRSEKILFIFCLVEAAFYLKIRFSFEEVSRKILLSLILLGTLTGVSLALYFIWTPVGRDFIEGIQGRYFIPLALFSILVLPISTVIRIIPPKNIKAFEVALVCVSLWISMGSMIETLLARYW
ncbi:DUF2142 domain-containing protein [Gluconobacter frateurii]|uniref:DUF2142 domain-containing protein n=1 Tax=Gluconobacter frateurii TaxID=38308 RepID=UPI001F058569|nr:DUF2142 domain-containing protein [Gluconobacter frateurii]UMM07559.1 DUF2142 domain-containing protein [Gluconobacter frateurii]